MATISSLAAELLLNIIASLDQQSLYNVSLVNKQISSIAQEALYYRIALPPPYGDDGRQPQPTNRLLHLIRTLLDRPKYANQIRHLSISTGLCAVPSDGFGFEEMCRRGVKVVQHVAQEDSRWEGDWSRKLPTGDHNAWAGILLSITFRLEELIIEVLSASRLKSGMDLQDGKRYSINVLEKLFQGDRRDYTIDLRLIPGLQNLQHITFYGTNFQSSWHNLPSLYSVYLGVESRLPLFWTSLTSGITQITIARSCSDFFIDARLSLLYELDGPFFATATHLGLLFTNIRYSDGYGIGKIIEDDEDVDFGCFDYLSAQLAPLKDNIESLWIDVVPGEDATFLDLIEPLGTWPSYNTLPTFTKLKHLTLPQNALFEVEERSVPGPTLPLSALLPRSLETLGIIYPTLALGDCAIWFKMCRDIYPQLSVINLYCSEHRGDSYLALVTDENPGWDEYEKLGISVITFDYGEWSSLEER